MWGRKRCAVCWANFAFHPQAKSWLTRQLCLQCRKQIIWEGNNLMDLLPTERVALIKHMKEENGRRQSYRNDY